MSLLNTTKLLAMSSVNWCEIPAWYETVSSGSRFGLPSVPIEPTGSWVRNRYTRLGHCVKRP
jgi:hypothetical protein